MDDSKFFAWRVCFQVIHLDNKVTKEERDWAFERLKILPLTEAQRKILQEDLERPADIESLFNKITEKRDRSFVIDNFRILAHADGDFSDREKAMFKKLERAVLDGLDLEKIEEDLLKSESKS